MTRPLQIAFFGSSLLSAYCNSAASYYRGILAALARRGHRVTFYEPDAVDRHSHRDIEEPSWAKVVVYSTEDHRHVNQCLLRASSSDVLVKASGIGVFDTFLESALLRLRRQESAVIFWDVDAPTTLDRARSEPTDTFRTLIPRYDAVLTHAGGPPVVDAYRSLGARACVPIYPALDSETHHPVDPRPEYEADLCFLGNRVPDREARVEEFFLRPAAALRDRRFLLGGSGWEDKPLRRNVHYVGHVRTTDHNLFYSKARAVSNITREGRARYGFSPTSRLFEAAGSGACLITDAWRGIERFLEPDREVLVAESSDAVVRHVQDLSAARATALGAAALQRILAQHTYDHRAADVETVLAELVAARRN